MGRSHKGIMRTVTPALVHSKQQIKTWPSPPTSSSEKITSCLWKPTGSINCLKQADQMCQVSLQGGITPMSQRATKERADILGSIYIPTFEFKTFLIIEFYLQSSEPWFHHTSTVLSIALLVILNTACVLTNDPTNGALKMASNKPPAPRLCLFFIQRGGNLDYSR